MTHSRQIPVYDYDGLSWRRKEAITAYLDAHQEEIRAHHREWDIKPSYNRKAEPINVMVTIPEEVTAFPWGRSESAE